MKMLIVPLFAVGAAFAAVDAPKTSCFVAKARTEYPKPAHALCRTTVVTDWKWPDAEANDVPKQTRFAACATSNDVRWVNIPGLRNVRDIGGWNGLRTGRVYRGSQLYRSADAADGIAPATVAALREVGIVTALDLRGDAEIAQLSGESTPLRNAGLKEARARMVAYMRSFGGGWEEMRKALLVFTDPANYPVYFHCKAGADRTGTLAFVLEGLCGVDETDLAIDYELTTCAGKFGRRVRNADWMKDTTNRDCFWRMLETVKSYPGATLAERFAACAKHLWRLTDADIAAIRRQLTPAPALRPVLHVAPGGSDAAPGTAAAPLKTLAAACARARETDGAKIVLGDGTYEEPLVLTAADRHLVFEAAPGARPVISAGRRITDWKVDAKGWWRASVSRETPLAQFYVDGQRRTRPFLPRKSYHFIAAPGVKNPAKAQNDSFICHPGDFPAGDNPGLEACIFHVWTMSRSLVTGYDPATRRVSLDIRPFKQGYDRLHHERWYRFDNVRTALGEPGDWYHDMAAGELIYVPRPGETPARCTAVAAWHRHAVRIDSSEDIVFRGIVFAYADYGLQKGGNHIAQAAANQPGAFHAEAARGVRLLECAVLHTGAYGAVFTRGSEDCAAERCEFADMGAGGVRIGDGWEKKRPIVVSRRCSVVDCLIEGCGRVDPAGVGVWIGHGAECRLAHNTIHDLYYSGVSAGWNWSFALTAHDNVIEWNHIYDVGQRVLSDMGGIYLLGRQPGTVERYNHIHDLTRADNAGFGIYFDSGTSGVTVSNNVVHDIADCNFFCAQISASNRVVNNIFGYGPRFQINNPVRTHGGPSLFARNLLYWEDGRLIPTQNGTNTMVYADNLYWCRAEYRPDAKTRGFTFGDPGFVDPARRDFRLKDPSAARAIGFVPFSIEGCGRIAPRRFTVGLPPVPPVFFPAPEKPQLPVCEDFEATPVGDTWPNWHIHPGRAVELVRVTDATAAQGSRSLEVVDSLPEWTPHMFCTPMRKTGLQKVSFALKVEKGAQPQFEVRDEHGVWQHAPGPEIHVTAGGDLVARGRKLMKVPPDVWFRVELAFELGKDTSAQGFTVTVTMPGAEPRVFPKNPLHREFRTVRWLGFVSSAQKGEKYWIDDFKLTP